MLALKLGELSPDRPHRATATLGELHIADLVAQVMAHQTARPEGELIRIDYSGIESMTGSYTKATILQLMQTVGAVPAGSSGVSGEPKFNFFPFVTGLNEETRSAIDDVFALRRLFCLEVIDWREDQLLTAKLRGGSDRVLIEALKALILRGQATATELQGSTGIGIGVTAWSNRLYDLFRLRLARRFKQERQWVYESVAQAIEF